MPQSISLNLRQQQLELNADGYRFWHVTEFVKVLAPQEIALVLCDVWDRHWCPTLLSTDFLPNS